jgi:hypothetical protein
MSDCGFLVCGDTQFNRFLTMFRRTHRLHLQSTTQKMEAAGSFQTVLLTYHIKRRHMPEDHYLDIHRCKNPRSDITLLILSTYLFIYHLSIYLSMSVYPPTHLPTYLPTHLHTYPLMLLQPSVGPWPLFHFLNNLYSRQGSLDGG